MDLRTKGAEVRLAIERLALLVPLVGEEKTREILERWAPEIAYSPGLLVRLRDNGATALP
ncbi:MAG: hypothetical protein H6718_21125 [Polyangiaceae bacterium]|nr:hypothetical protein [Myxococcales bacterium]MCB9587921.1 hypothetical protein [Polyangiaceae bacterium]